jgi:hypothetical protein
VPGSNPLLDKVAGAKEHWVGIVEAAHDRLAAKIDERKTAHVAGILEQFEQDLGPHLVPLLDGIVNNPAIPQPIRDLVSAITEPQHFTQSLLIGIAVGAVVSPVLVAATAPLTQVLANEAWSTGPTIPLSPDLLAAAVIKGVETEAGAASEARASGVDASRFHTMVMTAGQSFGIAEALLLLRRGQIDRAEFDRIVKYSNTRDDFIPDILKLMFAPPPPGEVVAGALKQHLDATTAKAKLAEAGIDPANFDWMLATAGRPYGTMVALQLLNRGVIDEARVRQVVAQSDVNPTFTDDILALRVYLPPPRSVVPMLRSGAITTARALQLLEMHGLSAQDAQAFVTEATHTKASTGKELTAAQVVRMYGDRFITRADATTRLTAAAFPPDQITLLLDFADHARTEKLTTALTSKVGTLYTAHKIDRSAATVALDAGPVPAAVQADLFHVWDLERAANVHHPTPAQVVGAFRRGEITALDTKTRLLNLGVQPADLAIIVADGWPPTKGAEAKAAAAAVVAA